MHLATVISLRPTPYNVSFTGHIPQITSRVSILLISYN